MVFVVNEFFCVKFLCCNYLSIWNIYKCKFIIYIFERYVKVIFRKNM